MTTQVTQNSPPRTVFSSTNNPLIKKCSIFERNISKPIVDSIVEVLDLELDVKSSDEDNRHRKSTSIDDFQLNIDQLTISSPDNLDKLHCLTCDLKLLNRNDQVEETMFTKK